LVVAGLVAAFIFLGPTNMTIDSARGEREIVRITQVDTGLMPTDLRRPEVIHVAVDSTLQCTAALDGQLGTYEVTQRLELAL
jgi:hypothetical protein